MNRREFLKLAQAAAAASVIGPGVQTILYAEGEEAFEPYRSLNSVILYTTVHPAEVIGPSGCDCVLDNVRDWCLSFPPGLSRARRDGFMRQAIVNMVVFRPRLVTACPEHQYILATRCEALTAEIHRIHAADTNLTPGGFAAHRYIAGHEAAEADLLWTELRHLHLNYMKPAACGGACMALSWQDDRIPGSSIPIVHPIYTSHCWQHAGLGPVAHHLAIRSGVVKDEAHAAELAMLDLGGWRHPTPTMLESMYRRIAEVKELEYTTTSQAMKLRG